MIFSIGGLAPPPPPPTGGHKGAPPPPPQSSKPQSNLPQIDDARGNLLSSIRAGIQLRSVSISLLCMYL